MLHFFLKNYWFDLLLPQPPNWVAQQGTQPNMTQQKPLQLTMHQQSG